MSIVERHFRQIRNIKLKKCDWTQATDSPLSDEKKAEWATYRQKLRDLPSTITPRFLPNSPRIDESEFPTEPS
tara:strand:- start:54 stop:272 length:219 start_codon:yes stop_codon:yes gene_type:complete